METKVCKQCNQKCLLSEYYAQKNGKLFGKCKICVKQNVAANKEVKKDYYTAYDRNRPNKHARNKQNIERQKSGKGREAHLDSSRSWSARNKKQKAANSAVSNAVRAGTLKKLPCLVCGELEVEGHHPDYDSPLSVIWLCIKHHKEIHRKYNQEEDLAFLESTNKTDT